MKEALVRRVSQTVSIPSLTYQAAERLGLYTNRR